MKPFILLALLSSFAFAQGNTGQSGTGVSRGNGLRIPQYRTPGTGARSYFVNASTGDDTFTCTDVSTPCLTIQAALNKIPKLLRDQATVNVAAGTYAGFIVSGFTADTGIQQTTGGLMVDGALVNSTLATGAATGTATGGTAGSSTGAVFGTLVDAAATWTVNDLVGRFLTTATPTNTAFVISSNTATTITVVGLAVNNWAAPTGATTYSIQDPSVIINTAATLPATPNSASAPNRAGILAFDNNLNWRASTIVFRSMRIANAAGSGMELGGPGAYQLSQMQVRPTSGVASGLLGVSGQGGVEVNFSKVDVFLSASTNPAVFWPSGSFNAISSLFRGTSGGTRFAVELGSANGPALFGQFAVNETRGFNNGLLLANVSVGTSTIINAARITCGSAVSTVGLGVGNNTVALGAGGAASGGVLNHPNIDTCETAVLVTGPAGLDIDSLTGAAGTNAFQVASGGIITFRAGGTTITAVTNEVNEDSGGATAAFADIAVGSCLATVAQSSRVCAR